MRILTVYATNSGGTEQVAQIVAEVCQRFGHSTTLQRARDATPDELDAFDLVVLGSSTWSGQDDGQPIPGQLQEHMAELIERIGDRTYPEQKFALFALGDRTYGHFCAAADHLEVFVHRVRGHIIGPVLRVDQFFTNQPKQEALVRGWIEAVLRQAG